MGVNGETAFQLVGMFKHTAWWTVLVSATVAFTFMGILKIAAEIENPFGYDHNGMSVATDTFTRMIEADSRCIPFMRRSPARQVL